ncbi:PREDICTED: dnaJ homolog subfamily C member 28 [Fragaria vesca subsp. vesca]|uniref:dnaJ homolog subfamily C member 28 n=1 Tax=Fragaria vesca subsp. vesca TaxID=101020 RepID=UPI0002C334F3|nr:PREDICTED: dnaJ homolog subfamily C member 28 [Fragaria vesca subsp. vesca]
MATRLARRPIASSSLFRRSMLHDSSLTAIAAGHGGSESRRLSSSRSKSEKPEKKKPLDRLSTIIDAVNERKLPPELRGQRNTVRSETDIINVVEQRIWHSMEEGQFENLPGKGKPLDLSSNSNPHADPADDTLYRILSKNGCAPRWVELNKEIRTQAAEWRRAMKKAWEKRNGEGGEERWVETSAALKVQMKQINNKVLEYNLIVPFGRQMFGIKWEKELERMELKE